MFSLGPIGNLKLNNNRELNVMPSGVDVLDQLLAPLYGFPTGHLCQISGRRSCGKRSLLLAVCSQALQRGKRVVWIDGAGRFYPLPLLESGQHLAELIVVRTHQHLLKTSKASASLKAADILLRLGQAIDLLILDLSQKEHIKPHHLARLRQGAEKSDAVVIFIQENSAHSLGALIGIHLEVCRLFQKASEKEASPERNWPNRVSELPLIRKPTTIQITLQKSKFSAQGARVNFCET